MNKNDFSQNVVWTIEDSLNDAAENYDNAARAAASQDASDYFVSLSDAAALAYDRFVAGIELTADDQTALVDALDLSIQNTVELELDEAHEEYLWAKQYVLNLS